MPNNYKEKIEETPTTLIIQNKIANNTYYKCVFVKNSGYVTILVDSNDNFIAAIK